MHIIFLHGLESGIHGHKATFLVQQAQQSSTPHRVSVPDLEMSAWKFTYSNSFSRSAIRILSRWPLKIFTPYRLFHEAVNESLQQCADLVVSTVVDDGTDEIVLVGSSWGGAVACWLLAKQPEFAWCRRIVRVVLIAPAFQSAITAGLDENDGKAKFDEVMIALRHSHAATCDVVVIHGTHDTEVDLKDSQVMFTNAFTDKDRVGSADLLIVPRGDHRLNDYLLTQGKLWIAIHGAVSDLKQELNQLAQL